MTNPLMASLQITLVGITVVFAVLALVWIMIAGMTKRSSAKPANENDEIASKRKAAAIAAAIAIQFKEQPQESSYYLPPTAIISAWQLSKRTKQLKEGGKLHARR